MRSMSLIFLRVRGAGFLFLISGQRREVVIMHIFARLRCQRARVSGEMGVRGGLSDVWGGGLSDVPGGGLSDVPGGGLRDCLGQSMLVEEIG